MGVRMQVEGYVSAKTAIGTCHIVYTTCMHRYHEGEDQTAAPSKSGRGRETQIYSIYK